MMVAVPPLARLQPTAIRSVSTVDALMAALRDQILDGTLPAGTPLRETELCEAFGVSRHTARTALRGLDHEGLARHEANRGAFVPRLNAQEVVDLFRFRGVLERTAVSWLAEGAGRPDMVQAAVEALGDLGQDATWGTIRDADLHVHQAIVDAVDSPRMSRSYAALMTELRLCFIELQDELRHAETIVGEHQAILTAIQSRDPERARRLIDEQLAASSAHVAEVYRLRDSTPS
jgi:DNA-binding GntR family transcriptional regulator